MCIRDRIYTVLSTRAKTLQEAFKDKVFFIGPDFWAGKENPLFSEDVYKRQPLECNGIRALDWETDKSIR